MPLKITVDLTDDEVKCLQNDLLDINDWVQKAVRGKLNNCKKRLINEWQPRLMADPAVTTMPADEKAFLDAVFARPDYKNRTQREPQER